MKRILFITRKYPPVKGGMEKYSYDLYQSLIASSDKQVDLVANKKGNLYLSLFIIKIIWILLWSNRRYSHIHFGDALLSPFAVFYKWWSTAKWSVTVHGLDITYNNFLYQKIIPDSLNYFDVIVAVSRYTKQECSKRRIKIPIKVIPNGILTISSTPDNSSVNKRKIILSLGRLTPRKGIVKFIQTVGVQIAQKYQYIIAGDGEEYLKIKNILNTYNLQDDILLVGEVSDVQKDEYLQKADVFIMPNIEIPGDMEGFGITLIEATSYGVPVVARNIEGIRDAVIDGQTGYLVSNPGASDYLSAIDKALLLNRENIRALTAKNYSWEVLIQQYDNEIFI